MKQKQNIKTIQNQIDNYAKQLITNMGLKSFFLQLTLNMAETLFSPDDTYMVEALFFSTDIKYL